MPHKLPIRPASFAQLPPAFLAPSLYAPQTCLTLPTRQQTRSIRSIVNKKFMPKLIRLSRFDKRASLPVLQSSPKHAHQRKAQTMPLRTGAIAVKKGMTALYDQVTGIRQPCTVLQLDRVQVVGHKTQRKNGYCAVQVGYGYRKPKNVGRPMLGHFSAQGVPPKERVHEFRVRSEAGLLPVGEEIRASWFRVGDFVDAKSNTRGFGFTGGMKKHGWSGQPASHGQSLTHRTMGSSGGGQGSGSRVAPGKNMPGRMGNTQHTIQNLRIVKVDEENGLVLVGGPVSGPKGSLVRIQDAIKKKWPDVPSREHPPSPMTQVAEASA